MLCLSEKSDAQYASRKMQPAPLKEDIAIRPYIILEDAEGNQITLYGGTIYRSIGYVAYQNRNVVRAGTGADGGDISLSFGGIQRLSYVAQSGDVTGTATVLADGAPVVLGYLDRDEVIPVVAEEGFAPEWDGYCTLYLDGLYAYVPAEFVLQDGDEAYEVWSGYAVYGARVYDNYLLRDAGKTVNLNTLVAVLWDCGDFYVVSVNDEICYMATSAVSKTLIATGGGGGGGGDTDWTPPAL